MRKSLLATAFALAFSTPGVSVAQDKKDASPHTFTGNAGLFSSYRFRGIDQTFGKPALQGGVDYSHASGFYLGNWNSNVNSGAGFPDGNLEMDFYGGWKKTWGDWGLDVGAIYYYYPGTNANAAVFVNPRDASKTHTGTIDNKELYIGGSWKWISLKYFHSTGHYFRLPETQGSHYWDLSATYDLGNGWGIVGHVGSFKLKGWSTGTDLTNGDYTDWKIGVTKDINGWILGASYIDTNAKGSCSAPTGFYCFANSQNGAGQLGTKTKDAGRSTLVFSVSKTF